MPELHDPRKATVAGGSRPKTRQLPLRSETVTGIRPPGCGLEADGASDRAPVLVPV